MITKIRKRDGRYLHFNVQKIQDAITKALQATNTDISIAEEVTNHVLDILSASFSARKHPTVENVQDAVEQSLIYFGLAAAAKAFIIYREERSRIRQKNSKLMQTYYDITFAKSTDSDMKRENANINSDTPMGAMLKYGSEGAKEFFRIAVLDPKHLEAHDSGEIHIHDLDFFTLTLTCCQIDLTKLFKGGFVTGHGSIREPKDIKTYTALACIAIQSNQNDQHGGQSIAKFDYDMANGVATTYIKNFTNNLNRLFTVYGISLDAKSILKAIKDEFGVSPKLYDGTIDDILIEKIDHQAAKQIVNFATHFSVNETIKDTYQAMESLIHNLNTMHSRAGAQVPFSSINYGTDTSPEGRLVIEQVLKATLSGLGEGETPIFPIQIFKVKKGINLDQDDPNYDLFKLAQKVSAKRLFPNFAFLDAPFNQQYYVEGNPSTEIAYMGCRTRVIGNVFDETQQVVTGRGNLSFTSINLVRIALESKNIDDFYQRLDNVLDLVTDQLLARYNIQKEIKVYNFPFLMGQGVWLDSEKLKPTDTIERVIKHGTLAAGFIGLAESLKVLLGKHHGESDEAQKLGLEIVAYMRQKMDAAAIKYRLNFSLIATPAEGLSGRFLNIDKKKYGVIKGVTDHEYYTNSFHLPVYFPTTAYHKIDVEAPYHELTNGGHISYIELDGDPSKNLTAFEDIIRYMHKKGVGYGSINHSVDYDPVCKYIGIIDDVCPKCGRIETADQPFDRIRRITGYLVGTLDRFNNAKRQEVLDRVKHLK